MRTRLLSGVRVGLLLGAGALALLNPRLGHADTFSMTKSLYLHLGLLEDNFNRVATSDNGTSGLLSAPLPTLGVSLRIAGFMPGVVYTPLGRSGAGDTSKAKLLVFELPYLWSLVDSLELKTGVALMYKTISGSGGTVDLNNGTGTATFAKPGRSATSSAGAIHLGLAYTLTEDGRVDLDAWISGAFSSRRAVTLFLSAAWGIF